MSQVHEKLQNIPSSESTAPQAPKTTLRLVGGPKGGRKDGRRRLAALVVVAVVAIAGGALWMKKRWDLAARQAAEQEAKKDPTFEISSLLKQMKFKEVIEPLEDFVKANPSNAGAKINLALAHKQVGDLAKSQVHLEEAAQLFPEEAVVFNNLGLVYASQNQWDKAGEMYNKALSLRADYSEALLNAALAFETLQKWSESVSTYEKFLKAEGSQKDLHKAIRSRIRRLRAFEAYSTSQKEKV